LLTGVGVDPLLPIGASCEGCSGASVVVTGAGRVGLLPVAGGVLAAGFALSVAAGDAGITAVPGAADPIVPGALELEPWSEPQPLTAISSRSALTFHPCDAI
jgi:hypothetical protein